MQALIVGVTKKQSLTGSFQGFADFRKKHFKEIPAWLLLVFSICDSNTKLTLKKTLDCFVGINFLPAHILDSLQNTAKTSILNGTYRKNLKNVSNSLVKLDVRLSLT